MFKWVKKMGTKMAINYAIDKLKDTELRNQFTDDMNKKINIPGNMNEKQERKFIAGILNTVFDGGIDFLTDYKKKI